MMLTKHSFLHTAKLWVRCHEEVKKLDHIQILQPDSRKLTLCLKTISKNIISMLKPSYELLR